MTHTLKLGGAPRKQIPQAGDEEVTSKAWEEEIRESTYHLALRCGTSRGLSRSMLSPGFPVGGRHWEASR